MNPTAGLETYPTPIAIPLKLFCAAATTTDRVLSGADAGYSIVKYVALMRLSDWIREGMQRTTHVEDLGRFSRTLTGASTEDWWMLATALEADAKDPVAPGTPDWADRELRAHLQVLNRARFSRHAGSTRAPDDLFAEEVAEALQAILHAAAPLFNGRMVRRQGPRVEPCMGPTLPPGEAGTWDVLWLSSDGRELLLEPFSLVVAPEGGVQRDLYVYERLTHRGYVFENTEASGRRTQFETDTPIPLLDRLRTWLQQGMEQQRRSSGRMLESMPPERLRECLSRGLEIGLQREWRIANAMKNPAERPEVDRALGRLARSGVGFLLLSGASGLGKSFELARWLWSPGTRDGRVRLWIRAASWMNEGFEALAGCQANDGEPALLPIESLANAARDNGLAIAIDGINETRDPEGLMRVVVEAVGRLSAPECGSVPVQIVVSSRPEIIDRLLSLVPSSWRTKVDFGKEGVLALKPLPGSVARRLWDSSTGDTLRFDSLPAPVQRLLSIPILSSLARDARFEDCPMVDAASIIERFVATQTSAYQRILLRHFAIRMFAGGSQTLTPADFEQDCVSAETVRSAIRGADDPWGEAFRDLVSQGLLVLHGDFPNVKDGGLSFGHDRILQWFVGTWLAEDRRDALQAGALSSLVGNVVGSTALTAAVGEAFARVHARSSHAVREAMEKRLLAGLVSGAGSKGGNHELVAARHAVRAWAESDPATLDRWMNRAWTRTRWRPAVRIEIVSLAADVDFVGVLSRGLGSWKSVRQATIAVLSRVRLHNPEVMRTAIERRWSEIRHPFLHLIDVITVLSALLYGTVAENGLAEPDEKLTELVRKVTGDLLGSGKGRFGRTLRTLFVRLLIWSLHPFLDRFPQGPINQTAELSAFLRQVRPEVRKERYTPLIRLFAAEVQPRDVRDIALQVATEGSWLPTVLLERGLMVSTEREECREDALDLTVEVGRRAQAHAGFVPMAAEGMLYVLSEYLKFHANEPTPEAWDERFRQFEELAQGWLRRTESEKARRRWWSPLTGKAYKALYATAYALLWQIRYGDRPCPAIREQWTRAFDEPDEQLALDLIDDLEILALNEGCWGRALLELEPFLERNEAGEKVVKKVAQLLGAIGERDAIAVSARLDRRLPGQNRSVVAARMHVGRPKATLGNAFYQGFDRGLVLNPRTRATVRAIMEDVLEARSRRAWMETTVKRVASDLTGRPLFERDA